MSVRASTASAKSALGTAISCTVNARGHVAFYASVIRSKTPATKMPPSRGVIHAAGKAITPLLLMA